MNKDDVIRRLTEIKQIKGNLDISNTDPNEKSSYRDGISVIVPSYKGEGVILECLKSLYNQTLPHDFFEVILILNGEKDNTESIVSDFIQQTKMENIRLIKLIEASASAARNKGIEWAERRFSIFLDDDDYISENYLMEMNQYAQEGKVVVSQIVNVEENGNKNINNPINKQIMNLEGTDNNDFNSLSMVSTINACKLIPTANLKNMKFDPKLKSGEDVVFFTEFFAINSMKFVVIPINKQVIYYRRLLPNSVSRQHMTFDFFIKQRLEVISNLNEILKKTYDSNVTLFIKNKIDAQCSFINKFLLKNPQSREKVLNEIKKYELSYISYPIVNKGLARELIISYCFPPYVDTAGNVMAKRIRAMNRVVDVVYNRMDSVRKKDHQLNEIVDNIIENRFEISSPTSFSSWKAIEDFCDLGMNQLNNKIYDKIYSRAMWPGSHFLAYKYKINNPKVKWVAEFSDPILFNIQGVERESKVENKSFLSKANDLIKEIHNIPKIKNKNLFFWCEYLAYLFADEIVFTNENQFKYMIGNFPVKKVSEIVKGKTTISPHPTLPNEYYQLEKSQYKIDKNKVNLAYFGAFYSMRNLDDLFLGLERVEPNLRKNIKLNIFTSDPVLLQKDLIGRELEEYVNVNEYVNFFEFLNLTSSFDCLVVNDAATLKSKTINPYLPSKLSDYLGSGTKIWGIYEEGSILSKYPLQYQSKLGDIEKATNILEMLVKER